MKTKQLRQDTRLRYVIVIVVGFIADLAIAFGSRQLLNLPLPVSATIGLLCAVALNYVLFEYWVYQSGKFSIARMAKTYAASLIALGIRVVVIITLSTFIQSSMVTDLLVLTAAIGISFVINFLFVQMIFQRAPAERD